MEFNTNKMVNVSPKAEIAANVTIAPFATVCDNVKIGAGTWVGPNSTIMEGTTIGENCKIFPGAVIGAAPQDLKYNGEATELIIGNNVTIRECATLNRGTLANKKTVIGNNCLIMAYAHIAHDCVLGNNIILANNVNLAGHVEVGDYVIFEGLVAVQQFVKVGAHSFIAGASLVRKNVPPYVKAAREPLSYIGVNKVGLERRGFDVSSVEEIQNIYRELYVKGYSITKAIEIIETQYPATAIKNGILDFIKNSENGLMKGFNALNGNATSN